MAFSSPKVPVFCIVRGRWYATTDVFEDRDWLVKTYTDWFVPSSGPATVPLVETPVLPPAGGGSPGKDPRVDELIARIVALETGGGPGGQAKDPRVDGLLARLSSVEGVANAAKQSSEHALGKANDASALAGNAKSAAEQASVTSSEAKNKAQSASDAVAQLSGKVAAVEAKASSAEGKATEAESKASSAEAKASSATEKADAADRKSAEAVNVAQQNGATAVAADQKATEAKSVTDQLTRLNVANTYPQLQTTVRIARQKADNAEIIASGVSGKVENAERQIENLSKTIQGIGNGVVVASTESKKLGPSVGQSSLTQAELSGVTIITHTEAISPNVHVDGVGGSGGTETILLGFGAYIIVGNGQQACFMMPHSSGGYMNTLTFTGGLTVQTGQISIHRMITKKE